MNRQFKVLPTPRWLEYSDRNTNCKETLSYYERIEPVFNRDGWYYDRLSRSAWYEFGGRAYRCPNSDDFLFELRSLCASERPLPAAAMSAIEVLAAYRVPLVAVLRDNLYFASLHAAERESRRRARASLIRFLKRKAKK